MSTDFHAELQTLLSARARTGHRQLLLLSGEREWSRATAIDCLACIEDTVLLLGDRTLGTHEPVDARHVLGTESAAVVVDAWAGLRLDPFAAAAGTLVAGGLLLMMVPPLDEWPGCENAETESLFLRRFCELLQADPQLAVVTPSGVTQWPSVVEDPRPERRLPTPDQVAAIEAVERVACGHRRRPLVIKADRGRGKSAALGLACARLLREDYGDIVITGPRPDSVAVAFEHLQAALPVAQRKGHVLPAEGGSLRFIPPDALLSSTAEARLLLVDEAAAIPPALLARMLKAFPRAVFATTVHGYEGTGRGFDVRFHDTLDSETPQWRQLTLNEPIRWRAADPVEAFVSRALALDAEPAPDELLAPVTAWQIRPVSQQELAADEELLCQIFGLLVAAHYQTSPEDLRMLLDNPDAGLWIAESHGLVLGAVLVLLEGPLPTELHDAVDRGERRLRGQLLPQTLAFNCGESVALAMRMARVTRVAVHPRMRRRGIGLQLLAHVEQSLAEQDFDLVGSSFAADASVTAFWLHGDYQPLRLGSRRDSCSGAHALMVCKALSTPALDMLEHVQARFARQFPLQLGEQFAALEPDLAAMLLSSLPTLAEVDGEELRQLARYATGAAQYDDVLAALWQGSVQGFAAAGEAGGAALQPLLMKVLQRQSWKQLAATFDLRGRAEAESQLRMACRQLLATLTATDNKRNNNGDDLQQDY